MVPRLDQVERTPEDGPQHLRPVETREVERVRRDRIDLLTVDADGVVRRGRAEAIALRDIGRVLSGSRIDDEILTLRLDLERQGIVVRVPAVSPLPDRPRLEMDPQPAAAQDGCAR